MTDTNTIEISQDRVTNIARLAGVTEDVAREWIMDDWHEGREHREWIATATDSEIASWIRAGMR